MAKKLKLAYYCIKIQISQVTLETKVSKQLNRIREEGRKIKFWQHNDCPLY